MFDPSMEGAEIASWLEKQGNIRVIYDKKYGIFTHHLYTAKYDLIITDLDMPGVRDGDLLKNTSQQTRRIFHICITNCKDLYKVAFAEVHGVRDVLFKPVDFEALEKIIMETICGRKRFLIAASQARAVYIARSVTTLGHFAYLVQKEYELNRMFLEKSIDYVIYDDSFDLSSPDVFFKKLDTFNKNGMRSLALLKKMPDAVLRTTLETHGIENTRSPSCPRHIDENRACSPHKGEIHYPRDTHRSESPQWQCPLPGRFSLIARYHFLDKRDSSGMSRNRAHRYQLACSHLASLSASLSTSGSRVIAGGFPSTFPH